MKGVIILDCCGYEINTASKLYDYIDCFRLKRNEKFFKQELDDGRQIKKELMLVSLCPQCGHYIIRFLFYAHRFGRFQDWDESKIIRGQKADEVFAARSDLYDLIALPNPFKVKADCRHSRSLWKYYKMLPDQQAQIPRYMDESGDAGLKITVPLKVYR